MNQFEQIQEQVEAWLQQRSGSSKKHRDDLPSVQVLKNWQRDMVLEARERLDCASKLYTLIRLEEGK